MLTTIIGTTVGVIIGMSVMYIAAMCLTTSPRYMAWLMRKVNALVDKMDDIIDNR